MGEMEQTVDFQFIQLFGSIKHIYAPVIGDIRMDKRSKDLILIKVCSGREDRE